MQPAQYEAEGIHGIPPIAKVMHMRRLLVDSASEASQMLEKEKTARRISDLLGFDDSWQVGRFDIDDAWNWNCP